LFKNGTVNQHYISQAEQRLNSANPAAKNRNQRIYEFQVISREPILLQLLDSRGRKIENALSFNDLFSFDIIGQLDLRSNLEALFGTYEQALANNLPSCYIRRARVKY
jgi:hypothetical protein